MDRETNNVLTEQQQLFEVTNHQGWSIVRRLFTEKILELQNAFDIDSASPTLMLRDLQSRKKATEILWGILREIEGSKDVIEIQPKKKSHIVNLD